MLKVAIVGCGKIADDHAAQIRRIAGVDIVGVCDRELLMARQLAQRFSVKRHFDDLAELIAETEPDVVHITTPPESHFDIAKFCLDSGRHVYVEKPFTLYENDAQELISIATEKRLKITVGHDDQFGHAARRMRAAIQGGFLGVGPLHMESHYCYELSGNYAAVLLRDKRHWVRRLPGGLLQNVISHGIARIAEFLKTEVPRVIAYGFVSPLLKSRGETEIIDELRVIISEDQGSTAYFTFSSQFRPALHQFRIYGPKNGLVLDQDQETLIALRGKRYPSYSERFIPPVLFAKQNLGNLVKNVKAFMSNDFHFKSGMKYLIESFYRSIVDGAPAPIPYEEILLTSRIMDSIFAQLHKSQLQVESRQRTHMVVK